MSHRRCVGIAFLDPRLRGDDVLARGQAAAFAGAGCRVPLRHPRAGGDPEKPLAAKFD